MLQSVVSARTPLGAQTQRPERQSDIVRNDEQVFGRDMFGIHPVAHGLTGKIHIGRRFEQEEAMPFVAERSAVPVTARRKKSVGRSGKSIQHLEPDVVPGFGVFGTDIPQSNNEIFHS